MRRAMARNNPVEPRNDLLETFAAGVKPVAPVRAKASRTVDPGKEHECTISDSKPCLSAESANDPAAGPREARAARHFGNNFTQRLFPKSVRQTAETTAYVTRSSSVRHPVRKLDA